MIDVGRDKAFGGYIEFLDAFHIPWAIIADGPALHPGSDLYKQLKEQGLLAALELDSAEPVFDEWKGFWQEHGVFSVADVFGDDGSHAGEFEACRQRLNPQLLSQVARGRSKLRVGTAFASQHPMPDEIADLYVQIRERLASTA